MVACKVNKKNFNAAVFLLQFCSSCCLVLAVCLKLPGEAPFMTLLRFIWISTVQFTLSDSNNRARTYAV